MFSMDGEAISTCRTRYGREHITRCGSDNLYYARENKSAISHLYWYLHVFVRGFVSASIGEHRAGELHTLRITTSMLPVQNGA